jgi:hypothetical protein
LSDVSPDPEKATTDDRARVVELERRIHIIEAQDDDAFGRFTHWDWWICTLGAILLPILLLIWFRP